MRREWKIRIGWLFMGLALGSIPSCVTFWEVDSCLDQGGRWNYQLEQCEF
ncbi:MAG: hypothetical protein AB7L92_08870 [Alphaproteobacteria bacterium]